MASNIDISAIYLGNHADTDTFEGNFAVENAWELFGTYGSDDRAEHAKAVRTAIVLDSLFPTPWWTADPASEMVAQWQIPFYASASPESAAIVFHPAGAPPVQGLIPLGTVDDVSVSVQSRAEWQRVRTETPRTPFTSRWLHIPRETLFEAIGVPAGNYDIDLGSLPVLWRLF